LPFLFAVIREDVQAFFFDYTTSEIFFHEVENDAWSSISFEQAKVLAAERRQELEESAAAAAEGERLIRGPPSLDQLQALAIGTVDEQQRQLRTDVYSRARENHLERSERLDDILVQHRNAVASGPYGDNRGIADLVGMKKEIERWDGPQEISGVSSVSLGPPQYQTGQMQVEAQVTWGGKRRREETKEKARQWKAEEAAPQDLGERAEVEEELRRAAPVEEVPETREARLARWRAVEQALALSLVG
jgi:hypothetical protein